LRRGDATNGALAITVHAKGTTLSNTTDKQCLVCGKDDAQTPLVSLVYREQPLWICPQHLPVLIHDPGRLVGTLPGAENLEPADHDD